VSKGNAVASSSFGLKNAIDFLFREWNHKVAGFVSYGGSANGLRVVVMAELRVADVRAQVVLHTLAQTEAKNLFKSASTPEDHLALATYLRNQAQQEEEAAKFQRDLAEIYYAEPFKLSGSWLVRKGDETALRLSSEGCAESFSEALQGGRLSGMDRRADAGASQSGPWRQQMMPQQKRWQHESKKFYLRAADRAVDHAPYRRVIEVW